MKVIESINQGLHKAFEKDPSVMLIGEDILDPYGGAFKAAKGLSSRYSERVLTTPVSEAGIVGLGAGLAIRGFRPVVEIMFGDFIMLASDQIINHISKFGWMYNDQVKVPITIRVPMGGRRGYGPTHSQCLEKHLLGIPGIRVVALSHVHNPGMILEEVILNSEIPTIVIENKTIYPQKLLQDEMGHWSVRQTDSPYPTTFLSLGGPEEANVSLITYGGMTPVAMQAAEMLMMEDETTVEIINITTLQPLPIQDLVASVQRTGRVVVAEEGGESYGVGSEISYLLSEALPEALSLPPKRIGALPLPIGNSVGIEDSVLPSPEKIATKIREILG